MQNIYGPVAVTVIGTPALGPIEIGPPIDDSCFTFTFAGVPDGYTGHFRIEDPGGVSQDDIELVEATWNETAGTLTIGVVLRSKIDGVEGVTQLTLTDQAIVRLVHSPEQINATIAAIDAIPDPVAMAIVFGS